MANLVSWHHEHKNKFKFRFYLFGRVGSLVRADPGEPTEEKKLLKENFRIDTYIKTKNSPIHWP